MARHGKCKGIQIKEGRLAMVRQNNRKEVLRQRTFDLNRKTIMSQ